MDCKEIQSVNPKDQSWVFIGRTDAKAETPILWPPDAKSRLIRKDPDVDAGEGNGNPLQYSCLENPMDKAAWQATVHGVAKSRT